MTTRKRQSERAAELDERQALAIAALLDCRPASEAAAAAGVELATLADWQAHNDTFILAYNAQRRALWDQRGDKLRLLALKAADSLGELLEHKDPATRLKAIGLLFKTLDAMPQGGRPEGPANRHELARARFFD